jgi:hypothetical protein
MEAFRLGESRSSECSTTLYIHPSGSYGVRAGNSSEYGTPSRAESFALGELVLRWNRKIGLETEHQTSNDEWIHFDPQQAEAWLERELRGRLEDP